MKLDVEQGVSTKVVPQDELDGYDRHRLQGLVRDLSAASWAEIFAASDETLRDAIRHHRRVRGW